MMDLFAKARAMHQKAQGPALGGNAGAHLTAAPSAPGQSPGPVASMQAPGAGDFHSQAKRFGLDKVKLDSNPIVARTQLMQHLSQKYGPDYMKHPGIAELLASFSHQSVGDREKTAMTSQGDRTVKTLLGG